jgi:hypothetical protein
MHKSSLLVVIIALLIPPQAAIACGAFFSELHADVSIKAQQALMVVRDDVVELTVQIAADKSDSNFAWVIPVPQVDSVSVGSNKIFEGLSSMTSPMIVLSYGGSGDGGGGFGCGSAEVGAGAPNDTIIGVEHFGGGTVGSYEYDILAATTAGAMVLWLEENGYVVPVGAEDVLQPYVDKGMQFLWAKVSPDGTNSGSGPLEPLRIKFPAGNPKVISYPLSLSAMSSVQTTPIILYVLAESRYQISGFASGTVKDIANHIAESSSDAGTAYSEAIDHLTSVAAGHYAVTEYAQDLMGTPQNLLPVQIDESSHYLTRIFMRVPKTALTDLIIAPLPGGEDVSSIAYASTTPAPLKHQSPYGWALFVCALLLGIRLWAVGRNRPTTRSVQATI